MDAITAERSSGCRGVPNGGRAAQCREYIPLGGVIMKRLITILTLVALISGISVAAFALTPVPVPVTEDVLVTWKIGQWIWLWIPVDDRGVELVAETPVGHEPPIYVPALGENAPFSVLVWTNMPGGFTLTVEAGLIGIPIGATDVAASFDIRGGDLTTWHDLSATRTLLSSTIPGIFSAHDIDYRFRFDPAIHPPGEYSLTIVYTATGR